MKQAEIATLLPGVFQRAIRPGTPLAALLAVMEAQHAPVEALLVELDGYFDPYRAPDLFVTLLAGWVDLDRLFAAPPEALDEANIRHLYAPGLGRLRELVAAAAYLSRWRGTAHGLVRFLETAVGVTGFAVEEHVPGEDGRPRPFHIRVHVPAGAARFRPLITRIVELEKPAYVTYELAVDTLAS